MFRQTLKQSFFLTGLVKAARQIPSDWRRFCQSRSRKKLLRQYFDSQPLRKLQVGTGLNFLPGWLNTDFHPRTPQVAYLDATRTFPFNDGTFTHIFSEHMIEHIPFNDGRFFLRECFRVLQPGGKIRVATPDLRTIVSLFAAQPTAAAEGYNKFSTEHFMADFIPKFSVEKYGYNAAFVLNMFFWHHGHVFAHDEKTLGQILQEAGFTQIKRWKPGQSDDATFTGLESHGKLVGNEINNFETLVLQAVKP